MLCGRRNSSGSWGGLLDLPARLPLRWRLGHRSERVVPLARTVRHLWSWGCGLGRSGGLRRLLALWRSGTRCRVLRLLGLLRPFLLLLFSFLQGVGGGGKCYLVVPCPVRIHCS